jgi:hypothetical protein
MCYKSSQFDWLSKHNVDCMCQSLLTHLYVDCTNKTAVMMSFLGIDHFVSFHYCVCYLFRAYAIYLEPPFSLLEPLYGCILSLEFDILSLGLKPPLLRTAQFFV